MHDPDPLIAFALLTNSIHAIAPVEKEPNAVLSRWRLYQVRDRTGTRQRHLVGRIDDGRVTSALVKIDLASATAITSSGRVYRLEGPTGFDGDADYVFAVWRRINSSTHVKDVSRALAKLLSQHAA